MSQENVELWRESIEDLLACRSEADWEGWLARASELWDPAIEWDVSVPGRQAPDMDEGGLYRGREAVCRFWREWLAAWETLEFEYELVDAGDRVVALLDQRMRGRSTGIEVPMGKYAQVVTFRNGMMIHLKLYASQSEALEAAGLSEDVQASP
jgi:SnoaL-like protein